MQIPYTFKVLNYHESSVFLGNTNSLNKTIFTWTWDYHPQKIKREK